MTAKAAFEPHRIDREQLKPLRDAVIVSDMNFKERISRGGLVLPTYNGKSSGIRPRWGQVYAVGPDQLDIRVGTWVCVEHGRWTRGIDIEDETSFLNQHIDESWAFFFCHLASSFSIISLIFAS
jgi:co-chaperonin GroES (HSP10)